MASSKGKSELGFQIPKMNFVRERKMHINKIVGIFFGAGLVVALQLF